MATTPDPPLTRAALLAALLPLARQSRTITYQALAERLGLVPPLTIHRLVRALETLTAEDAEHGRAPLAAVVVSRHRGGLPAPGFFEQLQCLGSLAPAESRALAHQGLLRAVQAQALSGAWEPCD